MIYKLSAKNIRSAKKTRKKRLVRSSTFDEFGAVRFQLDTMFDQTTINVGNGHFSFPYVLLFARKTLPV